jgi:hypothetical protein
MTLVALLPELGPLDNRQRRKVLVGANTLIRKNCFWNSEMSLA